jgi:DNA-directed RNA polymerase subunit RPC12/RpoP
MSKKKQYGCPHCKATEDFEEYDLVPGRAQITRFDTKGEPEWEGSTEMDWNEQVLNSNEPLKYHCISCNKDFAEPALIE